MSAVAYDPTLRGAGCRNKDSGRAAICPPGVGRGRRKARKARGKGRHANVIADRRLRGTGCRRISTGRAAKCPPGVGRTKKTKSRSNVAYQSRSSNKSRSPKQKAATAKLVAHNKSSAGRAKLSRAAARVKRTGPARVRRRDRRINARNARAKWVFRARARANAHLRHGHVGMGGSSLAQRIAQRRANARYR